MKKTFTLLALTVGLLNGLLAQVSVTEVRVENSTTLKVFFDDGVNSPSSNNIANYVFTPGLTIDFIVPFNNKDSVEINLTTPISVGVYYDLEIDNVIDTFGIPMTGPQNQDIVYNPQVPDLIISEIMYNPPGTTQDYDFFEIYNGENGPIQLGGLYMEGVDFQFPTMTVGAAQTVLVAKDPGTAAPFYAATFLQWTGGDLDDTGEVLALRNTEDELIDSVNYIGLAPFPTAPNGTGPSLDLINLWGDNSTNVQNVGPWEAATPDVGQIGSIDVQATPGSVQLPTIQFVQTTGTVVEGDNVTFDLELEVANPNSAPAVVELDLVGGTADEIDDFDVLNPQFVSFPGDSNNNVMVTVTINQDVLKEGAETVDLVIQNPINAILGTSTAFTLTILDDDSVRTDLPVAMTEIMYDLPGTLDEGLEFIELYNNGPGNVNLDDYFFSTGLETTLATGVLAEGSYLLIAADAALFQSVYGFAADQEFGNGQNLDDNGATLTLRDPLGNIVDRLTYGTTAPWPVNPGASGSSISLCNPTADNSNGINWSASFVPVIGQMVSGMQLRAHPGNTCQPVTTFVLDDIGLPEAGGQTFDFELELINGNTNPSEVTVNISSATTAIEGEDFTFSATTVTFDSGSTSATFPFTVIDDDFDESAAPDTVVLNLTNANNCVAFGTLQILIVDDESNSSVGSLAGKEAQLKAFPNPANGGTITLNKRTSFTVMNVLGEQVSAYRNTNELDVSTFRSGIYLLRSDAGEVVRLIVR